MNGKRLRKSFGTKLEAETWLHVQSVMLNDQGHAAFAMSDTQRTHAVIRALATLLGGREGTHPSLDSNSANEELARLRDNIRHLSCLMSTLA
ncbi:MAG: hypothetical protein O3B24_05340 [Verrucomicrobia bacterium]|nr:hypothetical protein [Verrucomicrobiota bacterium]